VTIRPATADDIFSLLNLERQCPTAAHWTEQQYRQVFRRGVACLILVVEASPPAASDSESGGDLVGFLVARHLAPEWELENIVVALTSRRKGLGKRLLEALLAAAHETNSDSVFLEVRESNAAARTFYVQAGFEQSGRRKAYYANPVEDAILYRLTMARTVS
jgi:[ribosomal protein S18]-alanine N-acetyltransferase